MLHNRYIFGSKGFSLIEMMCALSLSFIILTGILTLFLKVKSQYNNIQKSYEFNTNINFAGQILVKLISFAGFIGCGNLMNDFPILNFSIPNVLQFNSSNNIQIFHKPPGFLNIRQKTYGDVVIVRHMERNAIRLTAPIFSGARIISVPKDRQYNVGDYLLLSDCSHAVLSVIKRVVIHNKSQSITVNNPVSSKFSSGSLLGRLKIFGIFVAATGRKDQVYALYIKFWNKHREELIPGIRFLYAKLNSCNLKLNLHWEYKNRIINFIIPLWEHCFVL